MKLYAFDTKPEGDPHAVQIELSDEDRQRVERQKAEDYKADFPDEKVWTPVLVTDQDTGGKWTVASAPCGADEGCHCAAVAQRV